MLLRKMDLQPRLYYIHIYIVGRLRIRQTVTDYESVLRAAPYPAIRPNTAPEVKPEPPGYP